jgi:hypothetical protein
MPENKLVGEQAGPIKNNLPAVWDLVIKDMHGRDKEGRAKYGTPLQPFNGRDVLIDAYQEALDLVVYLRQAIYEREKINYQYLLGELLCRIHRDGGHKIVEVGYEEATKLAVDVVLQERQVLIDGHKP